MKEQGVKGTMGFYNIFEFVVFILKQLIQYFLGDLLQKHQSVFEYLGWTNPDADPEKTRKVSQVLNILGILAVLRLLHYFLGTITAWF